MTIKKISALLVEVKEMFINKRLKKIVGKIRKQGLNWEIARGRVKKIGF
jgi:hypothetical protein